MNTDEYLESNFREAFILSNEPSVNYLWRRMLQCVLFALSRENKERTERELLQLIISAQGHSVGAIVDHEQTPDFTHAEKESADGELQAYFARQKRLFDLDGEIDLHSFEMDCTSRLAKSALERLGEIRANEFVFKSLVDDATEA